MNRKYALPILKVSFSILVWGISFVAIKVTVAEIQPFSVTWLRFGMGVAILGGTALLRRQFAFSAGKDLGWFILLGFLGIAFHQWLQTTGMQTAQPSIASWIVSTSPVFIALLGWLILKEKLDWIQGLGIGIALAGVLLIVSRGSLSAVINGHFGSLGDLLFLISAPNWAVFSVLSRRVMRSHPAAQVMFFVMLAGWLVTSIFFFSGPGLGDIAHLSGRGWLAITFLGIFCSGLAYSFWFDALEALPASTVGAFLYLEPLVTLIASAVLIQETILLSSVIGGAVILLGVWLVNRKAARETERPQSPSGIEARADPGKPV